MEPSLNLLTLHGAKSQYHIPYFPTTMAWGKVVVARMAKSSQLGVTTTRCVDPRGLRDGMGIVMFHNQTKY